jgi:multiple sugar transport system permease protein
MNGEDGMHNRRTGRLMRAQARAGYAMITPLFAGLIVFYVYAFGQSLYDSFTNKSSFGKPAFVGLTNYVKLFNAPYFYQSLGNTLLYVALCVPLVVALSVMLASLLNQQLRGRGLYRTMVFLPAVTLPAAIALMWKWLMNYEFGLINDLLKMMGLTGVAWLSDPVVVLLSVSAVFVWSSVAYQVIVLLAGLQGISRSYYEAAIIDGATGLQQFWRITIPLLTPSIFFVTVTSIINVFQIFDIIYLMIPQYSSGTAASRSLVSYFFEEAFIRFHKGYGAAISMILFLLILAMTLLQMKLQKRWVHYDD